MFSPCRGEFRYYSAYLSVEPNSVALIAAHYDSRFRVSQVFRRDFAVGFLPLVKDDGCITTSRPSSLSDLARLVCPYSVITFPLCFFLDFATANARVLTVIKSIQDKLYMTNTRHFSEPTVKNQDIEPSMNMDSTSLNCQGMAVQQPRKTPRNVR